MKRNLWLENIFRPLVIGAMFGCIAISVVDLVHIFAPDWNGTYLVAVCVLAAMEAGYSYRLMRARFYSDPLRFRITELALFFILIKAASYVGDSWASVAADIQSWPDNPLNILTAEVMGAFVLAILSWGTSTQTTRDLERIGEPPAHRLEQSLPRENIANRIWGGGVLLLLITGTTHVWSKVVQSLTEEGTLPLWDLRLPSIPGLILNVLVYFLLGLVMLAQVQYVTLHKHWQTLGARVTDKLAGRWVRYSLILIGLATLVAFLLPTGYTVGLLDILKQILDLFLLILALISELIFSLFSLLLSLISSLLDVELQPSQTAPPSALGEIPPQRVDETGIDWLQWLQSALFWVVALGAVFYVVRSYLRDHPGLLRALTSFGPIRLLRQIWAAIWGWLTGVAEAIGERIPRRLSLRRAGRETPLQKRLRFFRLGALSPRERTLYYYLSTLRRAGRQGFPRRPSQTPHEYDDTLEPHLPYAQQEMAALTEAFVEARYSEHPVDQVEEKQVRSRWQRVKAALRALKKKRK